MNKLKVLFLTLMLIAFSAPISAKIVVLNAEVAMLSTQFAQRNLKTLMKMQALLLIEKD